MSAVRDLFDFIDGLTFSRKPAKEEFNRTDEKEIRTGNCCVAEEIWNSAVYIGPGGPLMRDR